MEGGVVLPHYMGGAEYRGGGDGDTLTVAAFI